MFDKYYDEFKIELDVLRQDLNEQYVETVFSDLTLWM